MQKVINPYTFIGTKHKEVLDFIGANLPPDPTFEQLNEILVNGSITADPDHLTISGFAATFAGTILPNVYNGYVNNWQLIVDNKQTAAESTNRTSDIGHPTFGNTPYTEKQQAIIHQLLQGIRSVEPNLIADFISSMEEEVVSSGLTFEEQIPLFIATACGKADFEYWANQIETPGIWATYWEPNVALNYMFLPRVVAASAQGALLSYGLMKKPEIQLLDVYVSLIGSTGLAAGKVVFGWMGK